MRGRGVDAAACATGHAASHALSVSAYRTAYCTRDGATDTAAYARRRATAQTLGGDSHRRDKQGGNYQLSYIRLHASVLEIFGGEVASATAEP